MLITWSRGNAPSHVARYFDLEEFTCKCGVCEKQLVDSDLLVALDAFREKINAPLHIHSGYRCEEHNKKEGGKKNSRHLRGLAADVHSPDYSIEQLEKLAEEFFKRIGIAKNFLHLDNDGPITRWVY